MFDLFNSAFFSLLSCLQKNLEESRHQAKNYLQSLKDRLTSPRATLKQTITAGGMHAMRSDTDLDFLSADKTKWLIKNLNSSKTGMNNAARSSHQQLRAGTGLWSRFVSDESGQALVLAAVSLTALMGAMSLAIDVGYIHYKQSQLQTAADSAAIAAGLELGNCSDSVCTNMKTAAAQALIEDGITSATITASSSCTVSKSSGLAMIINVAPCVLGTGDPNNGNTHIAEVVLTQPQNMFFGALIGFPKMNLVARAEAGDSYINTASSGGNCIYANSIEFNSNATLTANNCSVYDNGNFQTNTNETVTASTFLYYGSWSPNNCNKTCSWTLGSSESQATHTTTQQSNPLATTYATAPSKPATTYTNVTFNSNTGVNNIGPGYYQGDLNINSNTTVNLSPGLYYFDGSLNVDSNSTLECTGCTGGLGVTLYFNSGSLQANSNSTVQLTAATTGSQTNGALPNMVLWGGSGASNMAIDSNSQSYSNGIIYLPTLQLTLNSNAKVLMNSGSSATALVVNDLMLDSNEDFVINGSGGYLGGGSGQTLGTFALAE